MAQSYNVTLGVDLRGYMEVDVTADNLEELRGKIEALLDADGDNALVEVDWDSSEHCRLVRVRDETGEAIEIPGEEALERTSACRIEDAARAALAELERMMEDGGDSGDSGTFRCVRCDRERRLRRERTHRAWTVIEELRGAMEIEDPRKGLRGEQ